MKKNILIILFLSMSVTLFAQNRRILTPDGKLHPINEVKKVKMSNKFNPQTVNYNFPSGTIDTLHPDGPWDAGFRFFGQDWILQWFQAPTDLVLKKVGFACFENPDMMDVEVKIVKVNWSTQQLLNAEVLQRGYYEALGNGYNNITAFLDNPDRTGGWTSIQPGETEPFGEDIWSFGGNGFQITPVGNPDEATLQWVDLSILDEPELLQGEIFGIAIKHTGPNMNENRIGFWASLDGPPGWKFFANGKLDPGVDVGWWTTEYTLNFAAEVDLIGDRGPTIHSFTLIQSGLDTGPFTIDANITDDNPGDTTNAGVAGANIYYSNDSGSVWFAILMSGSEPDFTGEIPPQFPGSTVSFSIGATDINGNVTVSPITTFFIFSPSGASTLVVFNGFDGVTGYPQEFYWGSGNYPDDFSTLAWDHDVWAYGALSTVVVDNYTNIIEITTNGPNVPNNDVIRTWLEGDGNRNYLLAGDEWLGAQSGWVDGPHVAGEFHFDILGINYEYNDIMGGYAESQLPSEVFPQMGSLLGGPLLDLYNQISTENGWTSPLVYNPVANWMDGVDFEADVEVDIMGLAVDGTTQYNIGGHRTLSAGNKIAFFAFDPLSLYTDVATGAEYYWYGFTDSAPQWEVLKWFGKLVSVEQPVSTFIPDGFSLSQNYPNPFNPSTSIQYAVSSRQFVSLRVYDVLGNEVAILVNQEKPAGEYEIEFNVAQNSILSSGVYFYQLRAGTFIQTKKMILIK